MNMIIKTDFGEFNFNLDNQSAQEVVNLALNKAANQKKTVAAAEPTVTKSRVSAEPKPVPAADLLKNLADNVGIGVNKGGQTWQMPF